MGTRRLARLCVLLTFLAPLACDDPASVDGGDPPQYRFPLKMGTTVVHERTRLIRYYSLDGTHQVRPPIDLEAVSMRTLTQQESIGGHTFFTEREWFFGEDTDTVESWRRMRQTNSGLYRADLPTSLAPGSIPPLDSIAEVRLLAYPLAVDKEWMQLTGSQTTRRVEARDDSGDDVVWRIRIVATRDGPMDVHREWYGKRGLVRREDHVELIAVDAGSGEAIRIISDDVMELESAPALALRSRFRNGNDVHRNRKFDGSVWARE